MNNVVIHLPNGNKVECESATPDEVDKLLQKPTCKPREVVFDGNRLDRILLACIKDNLKFDSVVLVCAIKGCTVVEARQFVNNLLPLDDQI